MDIEERTDALKAMSTEARRLMDANPGDPKRWPDAEKLRLLALHFDAIDLGVPSSMVAGNGNEVQWDLRRIADRIERLDDDGTT